MRLRPPSARPFNLGDLMILVAAVAIGIALQRWMEAPVTVPAYANDLATPFSPVTPFSPLSSATYPAPSNVATYHVSGTSNGFDYVWFGTPAYQAWTLTVALVLLRWRRPRPLWRRIARQPGAIACMAVAVATLTGFAISVVREQLRLDDPSDQWLLFWPDPWRNAIGWAAPAVAGAWITLALRGRWSSERSWIDRTGRVLGWYWLIGTPLKQLFWPLFNLYLSGSYESVEYVSNF